MPEHGPRADGPATHLGAGDAAAAAGVFAALLAAYAWTMPPSVTFEDSGFFLMAAQDAGVNHPPGYPIHALLGWVFARLPIGGSVAQRVHVLSALAAAASAALLYACGRGLGLRRASACAAALACGLAPTFWSQAIVAEVYTLNALLLTALGCACWRAGQRGSVRALDAAALLAGLALANHWPLALLAAPAAACLLWPARSLLGKRWLPLFALFALGLLPYLWMVWRSQGSDVAAFLGPIDGAAELLGYVGRRVYDAEGAAPRDPMQAWALAGFYAAEATRQLTGAGLAVAALGALTQWRRGPRSLGAALAWACFGVLAGLLATQRFGGDSISRAIVAVYPLVCWSVLALWLGFGLDGIAGWAAGRSRLARAAALGLGLALVFAIGERGLASNDRSDDLWADRYARAVLAALPRDAVLFTSGDADTGPIGYLHRVEGLRPDVALYNDQGLVFPDRIVDARMLQGERSARLADFARQSRRPVFATVDWSGYGVASRPYGLFFAVGGIGAAPLRPALAQRALDGIERAVLPPPGPDPWTRFQRDRLFASTAFFIGTQRGEAPPALRARMDALAPQLAQRLAARVARLVADLPHVPPARALKRADALAADAQRDPDATAQDRATLYTLRGVLHRALGQPRRALAEFELAVAALPDVRRNRPAVFELLRQLAALGERARYDEVRRTYFGSEPAAALAPIEALFSRRPSSP